MVLLGMIKNGSGYTEQQGNHFLENIYLSCKDFRKDVVKLTIEWMNERRNENREQTNK